MDNEVNIIECKCGNKEMTSNYNYTTEVVYEVCDVCGHYHIVKLNNLLKEGEKYPEDWKPEYKETEGVTGFVLKIFQKDTQGYGLSCIEKKSVALAIESLSKDVNVERFAITFKDKLGNYQTQIYKH